MEKESLDLKEITLKFKILGLPFTARKEDVRRARNTLLHHYHPDKHPSGWTLDGTSPEKRVYLIQNAYLYIIENFDEISHTFSFLNDDALTNQLPIKTRSHWAYVTVEALKKKMD